VDPSPLSGTPTPLAGNDLEVATVPLAGKKRLKHSFFANGSREVVDLLLGEALSWIVSIGAKKLDRYMPEMPNVLDDRFLGKIIADECGKAPPETTAGTLFRLVGWVG
jgi:hypothetical protein